MAFREQGILTLTGNERIIRIKEEKDVRIDSVYNINICDSKSNQK